MFSCCSKITRLFLREHRTIKDNKIDLEKFYLSVYKIRHIFYPAPHRMVCMPASAGRHYPRRRKQMEDTAMYNTHSHIQIPVPAPKDLDDLIFQGEVWLISDR